MWKIQTGSIGGWADLKATFDDGETYVADLYDTKEEAEAELATLVEALEEFEGRVVAEDVEQEFDLY